MTAAAKPLLLEFLFLRAQGILTEKNKFLIPTRLNQIPNQNSRIQLKSDGYVKNDLHCMAREVSNHINISFNM